MHLFDAILNYKIETQLNNGNDFSNTNRPCPSGEDPTADRPIGPDEDTSTPTDKPLDDSVTDKCLGTLGTTLRSL